DVGGVDYHEYYRVLEQLGESRRAGVEQGPRVVAVELYRGLDPLVLVKRRVRGYDLEPGPARLRQRAPAVGAGRPEGRGRRAREGLIEPGGRRTVAGQRAVVQVHRGDRVFAEAGEHRRGHERGHRLARAARAAKDEDPARFADRQPGAVPVLRLLVTGAGTVGG